MTDTSALSLRAPLRALHRPARLQKAGKVRSLAQLRDAQVERTEPRLQRPISIAVAVGKPPVRAFMPACADQCLDVSVHDDLQHRLSQRTQEIAVVGLLYRFNQRHSLFGHRVLLGCR
jgi:hypothetical protein